MTKPIPAETIGVRRRVRSGLWGRQLDRYPTNGPRAAYLGIVVLATIVLYYELYVQGAVAPHIISSLHMSFAYFVGVAVVGNALGALGSLGAGLADRWGRANLVVYGLALASVLVLFGLPNAGNKQTYLVLYTAVCIVEGIVLVATPALIRDFSPQLGRASAMGFWTMGPVIGSLIVTEVASHTLTSHPDWQFQFRVCGVVGLLASVIAFIGLRELTPQLRDQLMISLRDRALIEARASDVDPENALEGHWRQMLRLDITGPAFAISVFLLFYFIAVGFFVVFLGTTFGYSEARANALANWYWISNAIALVVAGGLSDLLKVRKPFMAIGGVASALGVALFAVATGDGHTSYHHFADIIVLIAVGSGTAFAAWMAAFTETVESHNPAATATGLAVWGATIRSVVTVSLIGLMYVVTSAGTLVDTGTQVQTLAAKYAPQLATLQRLTPSTQAALTANPKDPAAQAAAVSDISGVSVADVAKVVTLGTVDALQLQTAHAIDNATLQTLAANPSDAAAIGKAVGEIATALAISPAAAVARLQALGALPKADLALLLTSGPAVQKAATQLTAAAAVPKADLAYLKAHAADVQRAKHDAPGQWRRWWWICFAGQLVFLPLIGLLKGRWNPRTARADAREHDEAIDRELRALTNSTP